MVAFENFLLGSHNFTVTALGLMWEVAIRFCWTVGTVAFGHLLSFGLSQFHGHGSWACV